MNVSQLSGRYSVRVLKEEDITLIYSLCSGNPLYYQYCPPFVTEDKIRADMKALPPGKTMDDKYFIGYFSDGRLIAVMDLIRAYPKEHIDFIGFFMVDRSSQDHGLGSSIIQELCAYLAQEGTSAVRLGWVQGNPQSEHFWKKNGFVKTGAISRTEHYTVIIAEKRLCPSPFPRPL